MFDPYIDDYVPIYMNIYMYISHWHMYEGHPIKNETFAIAQWIYMQDLRNLIQS